MLPFLKTARHMALHRAGGIHLLRRMKRHGVRILMYHRFQDARLLEIHCAYIRRYYRPVSLSQAGEWLRNGDAPPPYAVAVTVDDGYRDFLEVAQPVFARYGIAATLFVATDFLDGAWLWMDLVRYALAHSPLARAALELTDGRVLPVALDSPAARVQAAANIKQEALRMPDADRRTFLKGLPGALRANVPAAPTAEFRPCGWDEARAAAQQGVEFGAHTRSHPILSNVRGRNALDEEIGGSKRRLEEELGKPVLHFCYPNGQPEDISEEAVEAVRRAGFRTAVTAMPGVNSRGADCLRLRRIPTDATAPEESFRLSLAAV
jgi:peptidoglycan/xylan/chitin deacetylase (PgdA/CDA1 family)